MYLQCLWGGGAQHGTVVWRLSCAAQTLELKSRLCYFLLGPLGPLVTDMCLSFLTSKIRIYNNYTYFTGALSE